MMQYYNKGVAAIVLALTVASVAVARPVKNSFVDRKVGQVGDLISHVKSDSVVMNRYMRHFGMDRSQVLAFIGSLHRDTLNKTGVFTIYSVPEDGHLKAHIGKLFKGEPVFEDASGTPVLVAKCGNPLTLGPVNARNNKPNDVEVAVTEDENSELRALTHGDADGDGIADDGMVLTAPSEPEEALAESSTMTQDTPQQEETTEGDRAHSLGTLGSGWGGIGGLGVLGAIGSVRTGGAHTESTPEPASIAFVAAGIAGVVAKRRKQSR